MIDITDYLIGTPRERVINRFSPSELYYLLAGWTKIEDYLNRKQPTVQEAWRMCLGTLKHAWLEEHLKTIGYQTEVKIEKQFGEIVISAKADAIGKDHGIEIKTSDKLKERASRSQEYQARWYAYLYNLPFHIVQPVIEGNKAYLKEIGKVKKPPQQWVDGEIAKILIIYEKLCHIHQQTLDKDVNNVQKVK
jgi:hypothetical protein